MFSWLCKCQKDSCYRQRKHLMRTLTHTSTHCSAEGLENNLHATTAAQNPNAHPGPLRHIWSNQAGIQDPYSVWAQKMAEFFTGFEIFLKEIAVFFYKFFAGHSLNISWFFMTFTARLDRSKMAQTKHISKTLYLKYPKICAQTQEGLTSSS